MENTNVPGLPSIPEVPMKHICCLSIHEDSRCDVLVNIDHFFGEKIKAGDLMQIRPLSGIANISTDSSGLQPHAHGQGRSGQSSNDHELISSIGNVKGPSRNRNHDHPEHSSDLGQRYIFAVKDMTSDLKKKQPECQVCSVSPATTRNAKSEDPADFGFRAYCHQIWPEGPKPSSVLFCKLDALDEVDSFQHVERLRIPKARSTSRSCLAC